MKLTIVAATGGVGRQLLDRALTAGHHVAAVVRNPDKLPARVHAIVVDLANAEPAELLPAFDGADAVLSCLGAPSSSDAGIVSTGTRTIVTAMCGTEVRRIVAISAAPIGSVASPTRPHPPKHDPGDGVGVRHVLAPIVKMAFRKPYADLAVMEDILRASGLDWTALRPPRLVNKHATGTYRTAIGQNLRGGTSISRADLADAMLGVLHHPETIQQTVGIAY